MNRWTKTFPGGSVVVHGVQVQRLFVRTFFQCANVLHEIRRSPRQDVGFTLRVLRGFQIIELNEF
jgi:hypothetical protein